MEKKVLAKAQKDLGEVMTNAAISGNLNQNPTDLVQLIGLMSSLSESEGLGRIVAEMDDNGMLHIFNEKQLEPLED